MRRLFYFLACAGCLNLVTAQEISPADALNHSLEDMNGTARFRGMSGAFGALGGDLSALAVNPAGSAVFAGSTIGGTLTSYNSNTKSGYFGTSEKTNYNSFDLNQLGGSWVMRNNNESSNWKKIAFSINYETTRNFDDSFLATGLNPTNSIGSYFLSYANSGGYPLSYLQTMSGESIDDLYAYLGETDGLGFGSQQAFLGYQAFLIDPVDAADPDNSVYTGNIPAGGDYYHEYARESRGYNGKLLINLGTQYGNRWSFGANINVHFTDYYQWSRLYEDNVNTPQNGVQALAFENEYTTTGSGVSLQLGAIYKFTEQLRAGVTYNTPTWMWMQDKLRQGLWSDRTEGSDQILMTDVYPNVTNVYETYRLRSPGKWTGSLAYVFGKRGLISADYTVKDYGNSRYSGNTGFGYVNDGISDQLTTAGELRLGTEWRIGFLSLRGGYRMESSPYENGKTMGDLTGFSGGLGINFGRSHLDLAYSYWRRDYQQQFFQTGLTDAASATVKNHNVSLSYGFDL